MSVHEATVEWRRETGTISAYAALYSWNDPTGILLNFRGWALHDQWTGLIDRPRLPDAYVNRGYARRRGGDRDGAIADFTAALRLEIGRASCRERV